MGVVCASQLVSYSFNITWLNLAIPALAGIMIFYMSWLKAVTKEDFYKCGSLMNWRLSLIGVCGLPIAEQINKP